MLIKNVRLINPVTDTDMICDILISDGRIKKIAPGNSIDTGDKDVIDATGLTAAPGFVDVHVHFRDPGYTYKEDIYTGAEAAAAGGFTTVVMMANTDPAIDNEETLKYVLDKGRETKINVLSVANVTKGLKGKELVDMENLKRKGAVGFSDDGIPVLDKDLLKQAFIRAAELKVPVSLHEEDPRFIVNNGIDSGRIAKELGISGSDRMAEISMIERDIKLAEGTGCDIDIQHISSKEGVCLVREARKNNKHIHAEATPHHFSLTMDAVLEHGSYAKMNPPLRDEEDRLAIIEGLKDGCIEMIATDHAPHSAKEKAGDITKAPSGIIGLETSFALANTELCKKGHLTLSELVERMSSGPARVYSLDECAGSVEEGRPADIVIFDENEEWTVEGFKSRSSNSPFIGRKLTGRVRYTVCKGEIVYS